MSIIGEYTTAFVKGNGCGGVQMIGPTMLINSGGGTASNLYTFEIYKFALQGYSSTNPPNTPAMSKVFSDNSHDRDAHGVVATANDKRYAWAFDRGRAVVEVIDFLEDKLIGTIDIS
jgi:hypothetical protein